MRPNTYRCDTEDCINNEDGGCIKTTEITIQEGRCCEYEKEEKCFHSQNGKCFHCDSQGELSCNGTAREQSKCLAFGE